MTSPTPSPTPSSSASAPTTLPTTAPTSDSSPDSGNTTLHPLPGGKDGDSLHAQPDSVRDRDWPTAAFTPEDVFLKELAIQEAQDVEAAKLRAGAPKPR